MAKTFTAQMFGRGWARGPRATFYSITDAREWAETFGLTADACSIRNGHNREIARHIRDTSGSGTQWRRATPNAEG